jgi:hypothetical protein
MAVCEDCGRPLRHSSSHKCTSCWERTAGKRTKKRRVENRESIPYLVFRLKYKYFDEIKAGTKIKEYRLMTPYWKKRLEGNIFSKIIVARGSLSWSNPENIMIFPWNGYEIEEIVHEEFGDKPVKVFAILLKKD